MARTVYAVQYVQNGEPTGHDLYPDLTSAFDQVQFAREVAEDNEVNIFKATFDSCVDVEKSIRDHGFSSWEMIGTVKIKSRAEKLEELALAKFPGATIYHSKEANQAVVAHNLMDGLLYLVNIDGSVTGYKSV